jgi:hypothetical protein
MKRRNAWLAGVLAVSLAISAAMVRIRVRHLRVALIGQPLEDAPDGMPLLARRGQVLGQHLIDPPRRGLLHRDLVGFQNSATGPDLGFYATCSYSLMRPPRTGRRWIRSWERSATGWSGRGGRSWRLRWGRRPL